MLYAFNVYLRAGIMLEEAAVIDVMNQPTFTNQQLQKHVPHHTPHIPMLQAFQMEAQGTVCGNQSPSL